ncbi:MmgE/PrpD family protein [Pseudomonas nabeulensis]|uniref:MmgE/PrpD family protein n=1 Tax=Pseudomonas nabeulensis TaxID=2293833 RepID=UPI00142F22B5|nr:MmgE/PrpD family protein [Pseudomonas nabeulensis]
MATTIDRQWVARHLLLLEAPIPEAVASALGRLLADTVAIAAYARRHQVGGTQMDSTLAQPSSPGCSVWGSTLRTDPARAALLNGTAAEALDFQEVLINPRNNGHAAVVIIPAILALAEHHGVVGERLLRALWIAFAANISLAEALGRGHRSAQAGFRTTSLIAPVAAALGCSALLDDDLDRVCHGTAIAASSLSAGLLSALSPKVGSYSQDKDLAVGFSAQHAVQSVLLAQAGATGPAAFLTGEHGWLASFGFDTAQVDFLSGNPLTQNLDSFAIKPYPACFGCQTAIRLALELRQQVPAGQVVSIAVRVNGGSARSLSTRVIENDLAARFSLPYVVASAFVRGRAALEDFEGAALVDESVLSFMTRIGIEASAEMDQQQARTGGFPAALTVHALTGEVVELAYDGPYAALDRGGRDGLLQGKLQALCEAPLLARLQSVVDAPLHAERLFGIGV